jgi:nucleotide-binding universal stress UspA family protein
MKHILVAYDASLQAEKAFDFALEFANKYQAQITVVAVALVSDRFHHLMEGEINYDPEPELGNAVALIVGHYNEAFSRLRKKADVYPALRINFKIVDGSPAQEIVYQAENLEVDHIIVGYRGMSRFKRWLLGSVAKQVMIYAHCSITIVR